MEDYPRTLQEFEARFSTDEGCREYLFQVRWPGGFRCPRCGVGKAWGVRATLFQCTSCDYQTSVTAGTVFQEALVQTDQDSWMMDRCSDSYRSRNCSKVGTSTR